MTKVISITVKNANGTHDKTRVNDFKELNEHLADGWEVKTADFINSNTTGSFTAMYLIGK
tara:strand:- start:89 stop:268 length:180 start_codon:yes stop_codon:yes gene_type:complete